MDDDGSNVTHLIDDSLENVQFTLDDMKIIINRGLGGICSMNTDGSEYKELTSKSVGSELPSLSPDSTKIAFSTGDIYTMDIDGTNLQNLTNTPDVQEGYPNFSFDGSKIVYTTRQDSINSIYIMDTNGANKRRIISNSTKYYLYSYPIFNANGDTIFYKYIGQPRGLYSINVDGTNNTLLYEGYVGYTFPSIAADGTKIVFYVSNDIFIMNGDGTDITRLAEGGSPMISSNGEKIVFGGVKIMNSDGSGLTKLEYGGQPSFSHNKYNDHYKIVYIGQRQINKKLNKGIVF
jgi:Periplasmic component of the Tol biopolymer transport system